jgi:hypothetical protein
MTRSYVLYYCFSVYTDQGLPNIISR